MSDSALRDPNFEPEPTKDTDEISINQVDPREQAKAQLDELHKTMAEPKVDFEREVKALREELNFMYENNTREKYHRRLELIRLVWGSANHSLVPDGLRERAAKSVDAAQILLDFVEKADPQPMLLRSSDGTPIQIGPIAQAQ